MEALTIFSVLTFILMLVTYFCVNNIIKSKDKVILMYKRRYDEATKRRAEEKDEYMNRMNEDALNHLKELAAAKQDYIDELTLIRNQYNDLKKNTDALNLERDRELNKLKEQVDMSLVEFVSRTVILALMFTSENPGYDISDERCLNYIISNWHDDNKNGSNLMKCAVNPTV